MRKAVIWFRQRSPGAAVLLVAIGQRCPASHGAAQAEPVRPDVLATSTEDSALRASSQ